MAAGSLSPETALGKGGNCWQDDDRRRRRRGCSASCRSRARPQSARLRSSAPRRRAPRPFVPDRSASARAPDVVSDQYRPASIDAFEFGSRCQNDGEVPQAALDRRNGSSPRLATVEGGCCPTAAIPLPGLGCPCRVDSCPFISRSNQDEAFCIDAPFLIAQGPGWRLILRDPGSRIKRPFLGGSAEHRASRTSAGGHSRRRCSRI